MKSKFAITLLVAIVPISFAFAQEESQQDFKERKHRPPEMNLTTEQQSCLESILGKKGSGPRPTREAMDKALESCGIDKSSFAPPPHKRPHHHEDDDFSQEEFYQNQKGSSQGASK